MISASESGSPLSLLILPSRAIEAAIVLVLVAGLTIYLPVLPIEVVALSIILIPVFLVSAGKGEKGLLPGPYGHLVLALVATGVFIVFVVLGDTQAMPWLYAGPAATPFAFEAYNETAKAVTGEKGTVKASN